MTHNRANRTLSTQEEYARSGHTAPGMNGNAEGYIESTPALSAPGSLSLAGYIDPHGDAYPMSFRCLGNRVSDAVESFVSNLIINDIDCLKENGVNRELLMTCVACVVGWYNSLVRDLGDAADNNAVVVKIREAAQKSQLRDENITPTAGAPVWLLTLKNWSKKIKEDFERNNPQMPSHNAPLVEQYMGVSTQLSSVLSRLGNVESSLSELSQNAITVQTLIETNKTLVDKVVTLTSELKKSEQKTNKLAKQMEELARTVAMGSPMSAATTTRSAMSPAVHAGAKRRLDEIDEEPQESMDKGSTEEVTGQPTRQQPMAENAIETMQPSANVRNAFDAMDGIVVSTVDTTKITVRTELERLWNDEVFKAKKSMSVDKEGNHIPIPRRALFDVNSAFFFGYNADMARDKKGLKKAYTDGMTAVAVSITQRQWNTMFEESLSKDGMRDIVGEVITSVHRNVKQWEIEYCGRKPTETFKATKNLRALGNKWNNICKGVRKSFNNNDQQVDNWLRGLLGEPPRTLNNIIIGS